MRGSICAKVFTNISMGESMGVNAFEMGRHVSTNSGQLVCYRAQTAWLLKWTGVSAQTSELWGTITGSRGHVW